jgi:hypothetical protein
MPAYINVSEFMQVEVFPIARHSSYSPILNLVMLWFFHILTKNLIGADDPFTVSSYSGD